MTTLLAKDETLIKLPLPELNDDQFALFCADNPGYRIERTAEGIIVVMSGTGGNTGIRNSDLTAQLHAWTRRDRRGLAFDSSTLFRLPTSAIRSPDASWVLRSRLTELTSEQQEKLLPLCPDFVVELTSPGDRLADVQTKMDEWMANGSQLGWILHPRGREVHIYRPAGIEVLHNVPQVYGEGPVAGFVLDLAWIWEPGS